MIGVVLVTHGNLADEFKGAVEHVVGPQSQFSTVCIGPEDDMEQRRRDILARVADVDSGDGVIIVTDMFGGTPSNLSISVLETGRFEILAGMNLPMLIKLARAREDQPMAQALTEACEAGRKYINVASQILAGK
jgi:PTS system mannose-specific IIA component